jgi:hypothetical protein
MIVPFCVRGCDQNPFIRTPLIRWPLVMGDLLLSWCGTQMQHPLSVDETGIRWQRFRTWHYIRDGSDRAFQWQSCRRVRSTPGRCRDFVLCSFDIQLEDVHKVKTIAVHQRGNREGRNLGSLLQHADSPVAERLRRSDFHRLLILPQCTPNGSYRGIVAPILLQHAEVRWVRLDGIDLALPDSDSHRRQKSFRCSLLRR